MTNHISAGARAAERDLAGIKGKAGVELALGRVARVYPTQPKKKPVGVAYDVKKHGRKVRNLLHTLSTASNISGNFDDLLKMLREYGVTLPSGTSPANFVAQLRQVLEETRERDRQDEAREKQAMQLSLMNGGSRPRNALAATEIKRLAASVSRCGAR
jgi:hypothetical protein